MSALAERLRTLGRQAGGPAPARPAPKQSVAGEEIATLRRLLGVRERAAGNAPSAGPEPELAGREVAPGLRLIETRLPWEGPWAGLHPPRWPLPGTVPRERFLCFDTETTGLAGGTGTRAFMIGATDWHDGGLRVRQLLTTTLAAETSMLDAFASWLHEDSVPVSYNGRCYDAPLLATRYRLARMRDPLAGRHHVDLLPPVRRAYRGQWPNCRLATAERELLGVVREDDLPGSEAPTAWLSYLRHGRTTNLLRVLEHNRQDVISLARLLDRLGEDVPMRPVCMPYWR
jgi:uncharacterized protein